MLRERERGRKRETATLKPFSPESRAGGKMYQEETERKRERERIGVCVREREKPNEREGERE